MIPINPFKIAEEIEIIVDKSNNHLKNYQELAVKKKSRSYGLPVKETIEWVLDRLEIPQEIAEMCPIAVDREHTQEMDRAKENKKCKRLTFVADRLKLE